MSSMVLRQLPVDKCEHFDSNLRLSDTFSDEVDSTVYKCAGISGNPVLTNSSVGCLMWVQGFRDNSSTSNLTPSTDELAFRGVDFGLKLIAAGDSPIVEYDHIP